MPIRVVPIEQQRRYRSTVAPGAFGSVRKRDGSAGEVAPEDLAADAEMGMLPDSWDPKTREIDVILSTGADVTRYDWWTDRTFVERLSLQAAHANLDFYNSGKAPWLRVHNARDLDSVLGVIKPGTARIVGEDKRDSGGENTAQLLVRIRLSDTPDDANVVHKIGSGLIRGASAGYDVAEELVIAPGDKAYGNALELRIATKWTGYEGSSVPLGADSGSGTRSVTDPPAPPRAKPQEGRSMIKIKMQRNAGETQTDFDVRVAAAKVAHGADNVEIVTGERGLSETEIAAKATATERERVAGIRQAGATVRATQAQIDKFVDDGVELSAARAQLIALAAQRDAASASATHLPGAEVTDDAKDKRQRGMMGAMLQRYAPGQFNGKAAGEFKIDADEASQYRGMSLIDMARDFLQSEGISTRGMTPNDIAKRALHYRSGGGYGSTSDFPNILSAVSGKVLRTAYGAAPVTFRDWTRRATLPDFKNKYAIQLGSAPNLEKVQENGEFRRGSILDGAEAYGLSTYGKIIPISRRVLVNDDLGALTRLPARMADAAARLENQIVWSILLDNGQLADGVAIFHANHHNLLASGESSATPFADTVQLGKMRSKFSKQTDLDGATRLNLAMRFLLVPDALYDLAIKLLRTQYTPTSAGGGVADIYRNLTIITDPIMDDVSAVQFYGVADPMQIDGIEYAYLEGEEGPAIDSEVDFDTDGLSMRVRHDFGAGCLDSRGLVRNDGVA